MSSMNSKQRKMVYVGGIVVLLIPIITLGMPATDSDSGGQLAQLRQDYDLGESTLGKVDPTSASMNLVLLGLRGVASTKLWIDAQEQQEQKDWGRLRSTTDSIILLQPHFTKVWDFQGWNLAYNVSAEWDGVPDRYYWVKEGAKFLIRGTAQNEAFPELYYYVARIMSQKIGESDEWKFFRRYFNEADPDPELGGLPDRELNPDREDNYLVARKWFVEANAKEEEQEQHVMQRMLFRSNASKALMSYAQALQKEGKFEERTRLAWEDAYDAWTEDFGQEFFITPAGRIRLESTEEDVASLAREDSVPVEEKRRWLRSYQNRANYRYWRTMARSERETETNEAHRRIYLGKQLYRQGQTSPRGENGELPSRAEEELLSGLEQLENVYERYPSLVLEDNVVEYVMITQMYLLAIYDMNNQPAPTTFPLKPIWDSHQEGRGIIEQMFLREIR